MTTRAGRRTLTRRATAILVAAGSIVALSATGVGAANATTRVDYSDSVPTWATAANDDGTPPADTTEEGEIYLGLRNPNGAAKLAVDVSTPGNKDYRHWLSPEGWIAQFSPTKATYNAAVSYLKSQGLTITGTPESRLYIVFRGTAAQLGDAFGTKIHSYSHHGHRLLAPSSAPSLPTSIGASVSGVSIDQSRLQTRPNDVSPNPTPSSTPAAGPGLVNTVCSSYWGENTATLPTAYGRTVFPTENCGYVPSQLRAIYGLGTAATAGIDGAGQTVAIIDAYASPSIESDVNAYSAQNGEPGFSAGQFTQIVPSPSQFVDTAACAEPSGWQTEETIDVESAHAIAPKANVLYVGGDNCGGGLDLAMSTILDNHLANIVSNSYGNVGEDVPADVIAGEENIQMQAAAEGIGLYFSSGDNGDEVANLGYASPDFPGSSPYVTSVGGTAVGVDQNNKVSFETGWGDVLDKIVQNPDGSLAYSEPTPGSLLGGGAGGGVSAVNKEPAYQKTVVPGSLARGKRVSPDVAALADPYTGFSIGLSPITDDSTLATGAFENQTWGGTSLASPITAAEMALAQQVTHQTIGFANPTLYAFSKVGGLRDVLPTAAPLGVAYTGATSHNSYLLTLDHDTSLSTTKGYDDVTGLGSITFPFAQVIARGGR